MSAPVDVQPLFVSDTKVLLDCLRMTGIDSKGGAPWAITRTAIQWARLEYYERLGKSRIDTILTTTEVSNPTTTAQLDRTRASMLEVWLVKWKLLGDLPIVFKDTSGGAREIWNQEGLLRDPDSPEEVAGVRNALWSDIETAFAIIDADPDTVPGMQSMVFNPADGKLLPEPGGSVWPQPQSTWLRTVPVGGSTKLFKPSGD